MRGHTAHLATLIVAMQSLQSVVPPLPDVGVSVSAIDGAAAVGGRELSDRAQFWLEQIAEPESWVTAWEDARQAAFLQAIVGVIVEMGLFPAGYAPRVDWVQLDHEGSRVWTAATPDSAMASAARPESGSALAARAAGVADPALSGEEAAPTGPHARPWICGFVLYDDRIRLGRGEVRREGLESSVSLSESVELTPSKAWDLLAATALTWRAQLCVRPQACLADGKALRRAVREHLSARPELADQLAGQFPLSMCVMPRQVSSSKRYQNALAGYLRYSKPEPAACYRVPGEVLRLLADPVTGDPIRNGLSSWYQVASRLGVARTAMRAAILDTGTLTLHGRQCLEPGLVRRHLTPELLPTLRQEVRGLMAQGRFSPNPPANSQVVRHLFENGYSLAEAVEHGLVKVARLKDVA